MSSHRTQRALTWLRASVLRSRVVESRPGALRVLPPLTPNPDLAGRNLLLAFDATRAIRGPERHAELRGRRRHDPLDARHRHGDEPRLARAAAKGPNRV